MKSSMLAVVVLAFAAAVACDVDSGGASVEFRGAPEVLYLTQYEAELRALGTARARPRRQVGAPGVSGDSGDVLVESRLGVALPDGPATWGGVGRGWVFSFKPDAAPLLDPYAIRKAAEPPFTLLGSMRRYGVGDLAGGEHTAGADAAGTLMVLAAQVRCGHAASVASALQLSTATAEPPRGAVDAAGKLKWLNDAPQPVPTPDCVVFAFGKHKGLTLRAAGVGMSRWVCSNDFPDDVKSILRTAWGATAARW